MKAFKFLLLTSAIFLLACTQQPKLKNGVYEGRTQSKYKQEPFIGVSKVTVENNVISNIEFYIIDTTNNELFDEKYEKHFVGNNEEYVQQCRNDWAGVQRYPKELLQRQCLDSVDAVTGATWSYNMFHDATTIALEKAKANKKYVR
ncbi:MAG TPA: FMN-binding protein [Bacteroidales bacterium]